jgi:hypothetical protein
MISCSTEPRRTGLGIGTKVFYAKNFHFFSAAECFWVWWDGVLEKKLFETSHLSPGLPDFSWHNIPKHGKRYQPIKNHQMSAKKQNWPKIPIGHKIRQPFPFQRPSKIYQNWYFWFETKPSGNPVPTWLTFLCRFIATLWLTLAIEKRIFLTGVRIQKTTVPNLCTTGLPDFSWYLIPKPETMYQKNTKCTKWS